MIKHLYIALIFLYCATLFAQEPIRYTTKNGLPSNNIYDIQQDSNGFMWFATNRGVVKFDGETFKTFTIKDGLPNNDIWLLEADKQGRIHYATKSKYQGYIKNDSVYKFVTPDSLVVSPRFHNNNNRIWLSCGGGYLTIKDNKFIKEIDYKELKKKQETISKKFNLKLMPAVYNVEVKESYIIDKKLVVFDSLFNYSYAIPIKNTKWVQNFEGIVNHNKLLPNNTYWFGRNNSMLFFNFKTKIIKTVDFKPLIGKETVKNINSIKAFDTEIHISVPNYLLVFNYEYNLIRKYKFNNQIIDSKNYQDTNGNIWQSSIKSGVAFIPNTNINNSYFNDAKVEKINKLDTTFYVGISGKGFYEYNPTSNTSKKVLSIPSMSLVSDIKYNALTQTNYFISFRKSYKISNGNISPLNYDVQQLGYNQKQFTPIKDMVVHKEYEYFIDGGVLFGSHKTSNEAVFEVIKSGLKKMIVFNDTLYVSGSDGLHIFDKKRKLYKPTIKNELLNVMVNYLTKNNTHIIVGTDGRGVYYYNTNKIIHLKHTDGLIVQKIIETDNELWLATNLGVKKLTLDKNDLANSKITDAFYEADGLLQNNTNDIYLKDSLLLVASDIGLAKLFLNNTAYAQKPELYFKTERDTLHYKNGERDNISISFSTLDFVNQEHLQYQYRLLPSQKKWTTTTTILNFSSLTSKLYALEVKVTDQHNNQTIKTQYINLIPAWWQTTIAKVGFLLLEVLGFWMFIKLIKIKIRKKEEEKAQRDKRISGLELQALRSQMNPHFVHNSLNAIQYFIQRNEVELSENYLSKFSKLIRLFFEYSRRQNITIEEELDLLTKYLDIEKLRFEEKLNYTISICDNIDVEEQIIPSMLLQPIVENAVNHGLFHKKTKGNIAIIFKQIDTNTFQVVVKDDGIGINKAKEIYKKSSKNYQSNSSAVLYERLELLNQSKEWNIEYHIQDCSEIDSSTTGTQVTLTFKQRNQ